MTIKVLVSGAKGRMGQFVVAAVQGDPETELVAQTDMGDDLAGEISRSGAQVVVDFTHPSCVFENTMAIINAGANPIIGTTGLGPEQIAELQILCGGMKRGGLIAPNFAIGAVLMMRFAELAAPYFDTAEIIEYHHDRKLDAPSGTAITTANRMAAARGDVPWGADPTEHEVYPGARGGVGPTGIRLHAVRMHGMIAHQDVILGALGQSLTIRQDSYDRESFMPGVVLACKRIADHPGLTVGLDRYLGI